MKIQCLAVLAMTVLMAYAEDAPNPAPTEAAAAPAATPAESGPAPAPIPLSTQRPVFSIFPTMTKPERISNGVATVLDGARQGNLEEILRGSFIFPRSEHTKRIATGVLDSIFGHHEQQKQ